jgi:hypothetical protein
VDGEKRKMKSSSLKGQMWSHENHGLEANTLLPAAHPSCPTHPGKADFVTDKETREQAKVLQL